MGIYLLPLGLARFAVAELVLVLLVGNALLVSVILNILHEKQLNVVQEPSRRSSLTGSNSNAIEYFANPDIAQKSASTAVQTAARQYAGSPFATTCSLDC